ncbi:MULTISPECIES: DUF4123 domain-containing protein [Shewanella]|uniref:DUF4123 domain-containing protein n=1 Tax=Shewanella TaxID=22 RepID=UPI001ED5A756|nr:DUF4123 domain-containing protein [Shewanella sp.]MBZ4680702.1 hypothetical protein [Shewanella sp.]
MVTIAALEQQQLDEQQWRQLLVNGSVFLLADPTLNEAVRGIAESQLPETPEFNRLYWGELGRLHASLSPCLIRAYGSNWAELQQKICSQPGWGMAWVLEGDMQAYTPLQQLQLLVHHLRSWTWIADGDDTQLLRIADWKVAETLLSASSVEEAVDFLGPAAALVTINADGITRWQPKQRSQWQLAQQCTPRVLTAPQYQALRQMAEAITYRDYMTHLQQHHPVTRQWSTDDCLSFISKHVNQAQQHGFSGKQQQIKFLTLACLFGDDFCQLPWAKSILDAPRQGAEDRMYKLFRAAEAELDKEVAS